MNRIPSTSNSLGKVIRTSANACDGARVFSETHWVERLASANNVSPPCGTACFTDLPTEIYGKIFSYLNLPALIAIDQLGNKESEEARLAFKHVNDPRASEEIFAQIRLGNQDALFFCRERVNELRPLIDPETGETILITAVHHGHLALVEELLKRDDIDINRPDGSGLTALHYAVYGDAPVLDILMTKADINRKDAKGQTALHLAILSRRTHAVKRLLEEPKTDVNVKDDAGQTPLDYAIQKRSLALVCLLSTGSELAINMPDKEGWTPLMRAIANGDEDIALQIMDFAGVDANITHQEGWTALHLAAIKDFSRLTRQLIAISDIDLNARQHDGWTALHCATINCSPRVVDDLLEARGFDSGAVDNLNRTALYYARVIGHKEIIDKITTRCRFTSAGQRDGA